MYQFLLDYNPLYFGIVITFSFLIVVLVIPSIIHVANKRLLFDDLAVDHKNHDKGISRLGGVAIFCSFTITSLLLSKTNDFQVFNYLLVSCIILFAVGLKDDLAGVNLSTKFFMQLIVSLIMVLLGDIRLTSLYSVLNIYELPYWGSVTISVLTIMFITNAFNLIDGIDGLLGITTVIVSLTFGMMFAHMNQPVYACVAFSLVGASTGFLFFNISPARIFMGDTGSLLIGLISAVMSIKFIELNKTDGSQLVFYNASPSIAVSVLIIPIYDAIRVFTLRIIKKGSPFIGDNNHIHHKILLLGFNHLQATFVLLVFNVFIVFLALSLRDFGNFALIGILFVICILFNFILVYFIRSKKRKSYRLVNFLY